MFSTKFSLAKGIRPKTGAAHPCQKFFGVPPAGQNTKYLHGENCIPALVNSTNQDVHEKKNSLPLVTKDAFYIKRNVINGYVTGCTIPVVVYDEGARSLMN